MFVCVVWFGLVWLGYFFSLHARKERKRRKRTVVPGSEVGHRPKFTHDGIYDRGKLTVTVISSP